MKIIKFIFVISLFIASCKQNTLEITEILPLQKSSFNFDEKFRNIESKVDLKNTIFLRNLIERKPYVESAKGIVKFKINEMDTSITRPFELILIETSSRLEKEQMFVSVNKSDKSIIDIFTFNPDSLIIDAIYPHSSELDHDGIAIELSEDKSMNDIPKIIGHYIEVFETGEIKFISKSENDSKAFRKLKRKADYSGYYKFSKDRLSIDFDLRDGIKKGTYAYEMNIRSPKGCINTYRDLNYILPSRIPKIDSIGNFIVQFNRDKMNIENNNYSTGCDELLKLDFELKEN